MKQGDESITYKYKHVLTHSSKQVSLLIFSTNFSEYFFNGENMEENTIKIDYSQKNLASIRRNYIGEKKVGSIKIYF